MQPRASGLMLRFGRPLPFPLSSCTCAVDAEGQKARRPLSVSVTKCPVKFALRLSPAANRRRASSQVAWTAKSSLSPLSRVPALLKPSADRASTALSASSASAGDQPKTNIVLLGLYFFAWYALNVGYNITNKQVLNAFPLYGTVAFVQLLCAWVYLIPQWMAGIRPVPSPSKSGLASLQKISLLHGFGHLVTVRWPSSHPIPLLSYSSLG